MSESSGPVTDRFFCADRNYLIKKSQIQLNRITTLLEGAVFNDYWMGAWCANQQFVLLWTNVKATESWMNILDPTYQTLPETSRTLVIVYKKSQQDRCFNVRKFQYGY